MSENVALAISEKPLLTTYGSLIFRGKTEIVLAPLWRV